MITVMIVDDDMEFANLAADLLEEHPGIEVIGKYTDGHSAEMALLRREPKVLILDHNLRRENGIALLRRFHPRFPAVEILFLTVERDSQIIFQALKNGASGYLVKMRGIVSLPMAVMDLAQGLGTMSPEVARDAIRFFRERGGDKDDRYALSALEYDVITLFAKDQTTKEVAAFLGITANHVRNALFRIGKKIGASGKFEIVEKWKSLG